MSIASSRWTGAHRSAPCFASSGDSPAGAGRGIRWSSRRPTLTAGRPIVALAKTCVSSNGSRARASAKSTISYTIEDPTTFTRPWTPKASWGLHDSQLEVFEYGCHAGNYDLPVMIRITQKEAEQRRQQAGDGTPK